eukprot:COSAG02_NODE_7174_length_3137_cov_20.762673_5_plen_151_part_00
MFELCDVLAHCAGNDLILHFYRKITHAQRRRHWLLHVNSLATSPRGYRKPTTVLDRACSPHSAHYLRASPILQSCPLRSPHTCGSARQSTAPSQQQSVLHVRGCFFTSHLSTQIESLIRDPFPGLTVSSKDWLEFRFHTVRPYGSTRNSY